MDAPSPHRPPLAFEDFVPGEVATAEGPTVTRDAVVAFALAFDPQPFHVDEEAAKGTFVGELIASGWHSCAMLMRAVADGFLLRSTSMGAPGIEEVRWLKPVRPGDRLCLCWTILETKASRSRPEMGLVRFRFELLRGGEAVLSQTNWIIFGRRDAPPPSDRGGPESKGVATHGAEPPSSLHRPGEAAPTTFFDDVVIGLTRDLGAYTFTPEAIVGFASEFDPQPFHIDPEAACRSHFGGLCASGWHTAAVWMKLMIEDRRSADKRARTAGERPAVLGPSPGFRDLRWLKPVYAGDTIRYRSTLTEKRPSASRPGWGLVFQHNTGDNQHGERVFEFRSTVLWERR
jgi:acyl dehydratase